MVIDMKMKFKNIFYAVAAAVMSTACVGDLDTLPLNPTDFTSETVYDAEVNSYLNGLAKLYFQFASNDTADLKVEDGGASEYVRAFWNIQEVSTDSAKNAWADSWTTDLNNNLWTGEVLNAAVYSVYARCMQGIAYANEFLRLTTDSQLDSRGASAEVKAKVHQFRAEARFIRAYFYWTLVDCFGNVPFFTEESPVGGGYNPPQKDRKTIFNYVVGELTALAEDADMPAAQSNYPRADKGSVLGLLARVYLNAEVYVGTAMWREAKETCEDIYKLGYKLAPTHDELFRGDNGENPDARGEFLFAVAYDSMDTQTWGGTTYLTVGSFAGDDPVQELIGAKSGWSGNRLPYEYVSRYFNVKNQNYETGEYECADERGKRFYIKGRKESMEDNLFTFMHGWSCYKFSNIPHDKTAEEYADKASVNELGDIDFPLIRLGEIHLIYAEACMHEGGDASDKLAELAKRAGVESVSQSAVTEEWLMAERARELMWEGHRRTDLIRYGKFTSGDYTWPYKGGVYEGRALGSHMNLYPIPSSELSTNTDLVQNLGY